MTKTQLNLKDSIIQELPQIPYVIDQVGEALTWAGEALSEGDYIKTLKIALEVARYARSISDPNFYKTHLVIASILSNIEGALTNERFTRFDTASKATEKALQGLTVDETLIEKHGCFKSVLLHLVSLIRTDETLFAVALIGIKYDLENIVSGMLSADVKTPITAQDYVTILGYVTVMDNIRMSKIKMLDKTYEIYNKIITLLNDINY